MKKYKESVFKKIVMLIVIITVSFGPLIPVYSVFAATNLISNSSFESTQTGPSATISQNATVTVAATTPSPVLTSLVVVPSITVVIVNGTVQITAMPLDQNGVPFVGATTTFSSSDTTIATVDSNGLLTGVKAGIATITATSGTLTATTGVTVVNTPTITRTLTSIVPIPLTPTIIPTGKVSLVALTLDQNNAPITNTSEITTTYSSSDPTIATVDNTGLVTGLKVGSVTITVTSTTSGISNGTPQGWSSGSWGTNTSTFSYLNTGHTGNRSAQVQITSYTDGDAKWAFSPVTIQPDTQYSYSDYYQATVPTQIVAAFTMADNSIINQIIGLPDPASTWTQFTTQFSVPLGAKNVTIYHLINQKGSLTIDDVDLHSYTPVPFNRALVSITLDDGYQSTYDQGIPILNKYGFDSTHYIITSLINDSSNTNPGYMTGSEINTLYNAGHEIASHTVTHNDMTLESSTQLTSELSGSQTALKSLITSPVATNPVATNLAYPYGLYNSGIVAATKTYYSLARGVEDALNSKDNFDAYDIRVQNVFDTTTTAQVQDWVNQALATKTWLVLVYHSINSNVNDPLTGGIYNVTPTQFDAQLSAIKTSGITVLPMNQAFAEVTKVTTPPSATLSSIAITTPATKLSYTVGDSLDLTGLVVTGTYSDNSKKVEAITQANVTGFNSSLSATGQVLTIMVAGKSTTYNVNIVAAVTPPIPVVSSDGYFTSSGSMPYILSTKIKTPSVSVVSPKMGQVLGATSFHFTKNLKMKSLGNEVIELQKFLKMKGHYSGVADGVFGLKTKAAVIKFQKANGLKGDGMVGPLARAILNK